MKNTPGPRAPPFISRPSRQMTALSYSWGEMEMVILSVSSVLTLLIGLIQAAGQQCSSLADWLTCTTFTTQTRLTGSVTRTSRMERKVNTCANTPGPSSQAVSYPAKKNFTEIKSFIDFFLHINELIFLYYSFLLQFKYFVVETRWGNLYLVRRSGEIRETCCSASPSSHLSPPPPQSRKMNWQSWEWKLPLESEFWLIIFFL